MIDKIHFYGRDFTEISDDLDKTKINGVLFNEDTSYLKDVKIDKEKLYNILYYFLNKIDDSIESLIVNCKDNTKKPLFSKLSNDKYYFGGVTGVIIKKIIIHKSDIYGTLIDEDDYFFELEISLQIQSRFDVDRDNQFGKPFFLSTMLLGNNPVLNEDFIPSNIDDYIFDYLLLFVFKAKLQEANVKGLYRTYHRFERNDDKVKGSIDFSRHIRQNMGLNNGKISYYYRENSVNNYLNHLIVAAYNQLKKKYYSLVSNIFDSNFELRRIIENLSISINFPMYDIKRIIMNNIKPISHPFYTEYESLRKVCLRILRNEGLSIFDGTNSNEIEGILFYIPDLWEKYLESFLYDEAYHLHSQKEIYVISDNSEKYVQKTIPDYVFYNDKNENEPFMVLDAKFKSDWGEIIFNQTSISGLTADYDKCLRDMVSINAHATGVIFPTNRNEAENMVVNNSFIEHKISVFNNIDRFYSFPVYVPYSSNNFINWNREFRKKCEDMALLIKSIIKKEKEFMNNVRDIHRQLEEMRLE